MCNIYYLSLKSCVQPYKYLSGTFSDCFNMNERRPNIDKISLDCLCDGCIYISNATFILRIHTTTESEKHTPISMTSFVLHFHYRFIKIWSSIYSPVKREVTNTSKDNWTLRFVAKKFKEKILALTNYLLPFFVFISHHGIIGKSSLHSPHFWVILSTLFSDIQV